MLSQLLETLFISLFNGVQDRNTRRAVPVAAEAQAVAVPKDAVLLGESIPFGADAENQKAAPVFLETDLRRRQSYLLGSTGSGKTTALLTLLDADLAAGRGVCLLDARGDLVDRVLQRLAAAHAPEALARRLLLIDLRTQPADEYMVGFNPLAQAGADPYTRAFFVLDVLRQQFGSLGVQTEETMRACLLALAMTGGTLLDIEPLLTRPEYRRTLLARVPDAGVRRFFARFEALSAAQRLLWTTPILNKISPLTSRPSLQMLLASRSSVSIREHLDTHPDAVVLVCLAADELFAAAQFVGSLIVSAVASAVMRTDRPVRFPLFLYLDEFENFSGAGEQFQAILSEGRRFGLSAVLSHQASSQLAPELRGLIRNLAATQIFFATGALDADMLAGEIPTEEPKAAVRNLLMGQKVGEALLMRRGQPTVRVRIRQTLDPSVSGAAVAQLRQASLRAHGRPRREVEAELTARDQEADPEREANQAMPQYQALHKYPGGNVPLAHPNDTIIEMRDLEIRDLEVRDLEEKEERKSDTANNLSASDIHEAGESPECGAEPA